MSENVSTKREFRVSTRAFASALRAILVASAYLAGVSGAQAQLVAVVGTGTAKCSQFNDSIVVRVEEEREYFAWAQGYMSGVLIGAPPNVDDNLLLIPEGFPIAAQMNFMRSFCKNRPSSSYSDGVEALYRALGGKALR
ncbi:hypothetical protein [Bosea sp. NBC_00550]|uniref:hypothetical protein n=1 Tax=Bosea sp. NBC_00550 TaxID=2969621 RepID=UPI00222EB7CF|nr:hypothetical protein [Bosea sp. NBC_00550]UZF90934.1 hypothetical protein NWE53_17545 [Bosea sp. NBC_00550]